MFMGCGCSCLEDQSVSVASLASASASSGSLRSFASSDTDVPNRYEVGPCLPCRDEVASATYQFQWLYNGQLGDATDPRPCCSSYRAINTLTLKRRVVLDLQGKPNPQFCWYSTDEFCPLLKVDGSANPFQPQYSCLSYNAANNAEIFPFGTGNWPSLARLEMQQTTAGFVFPAVKVYYYSYYKLVFGTQIRRVPSFAEYKLVIPPGADWLIDLGGGPALEWNIPCLTSLQFDLVPITATADPNKPLGPGWQGTHKNPLSIIGLWGGAPCKQVAFSGFDIALPASIILTPVPA
jgi:hypothetical protein